jgi:ParB family chromosome partitioning protein
MGRRRTPLGRGLDALIPSRERTDSRDLPLDAIVPNRSQPRVRFDDESIAELADSIKTHGMLQPLIVGPPDPSGKHPLIIGERRWQAARMAGLERVPVIERDAGESEALQLALIENIQRLDLDPLEEAAAFERLIRVHGMTQETVAQQIGRTRAAIANTIRLLGLPGPVKDALTSGKITEGHARALLGAPDPLSMEAALQRVLDEGLNVRQTERLVGLMTTGRPHQPRRETGPELQMLEERLRDGLGTKVTIQRGRKSGRIVIEYYSDEDLDALVDRLLGDQEADSA